MTMNSGNQTSLIELDFAHPNIPKETSPIVLIFDRTFFRLNSWQKLAKIFYYLADKTAGGKEFFAAHVNRFFYFANGEVSLSDSIGSKKKLIFRNDPRSDSDVKFSSDCYVRIDSDRLVTRDDVAVLQYVIKNLGLDGVKVYLGEQANSKALADELLKTLNQGKKRNRYIDKNSKYFIARINNEVLLPQEKFYKKIEREFDRKVLIGDIQITEKEEGFLQDYMRKQLRYLNETGGIIRNYHPKLYAFGLVRFAMKHYSQKTFWPYFEDEYGISVKTNAQGALHDEFRSVMLANHKAYNDELTMKIDNISMHCFVADRCANQLFDYLFDFWRLDLNRNVENIYGEVGKEYFDLLLTEIKANNNVSVNNVMKHTSMALAVEEKSCRLRLRRILQLMDSCFWNGSEIPQTGNRINELLREWMQLPNGKFQKEQKVAIANKKSGRGETLLSSPVLCTNFQTGSFYLRLPREILRDYSEGQEDPIWQIKIGETSFCVPATLCEGKIGYYTEECEFSVPPNFLFQQFNISLDCLHKAPYKIKENQYRFFNEKGTLVDYKANLPCGLVVLFAATEEIPKKLYGEDTFPEPNGGMFFATYQANEGDIILFPDKKAVQVGQRIKEGLIGVTLQGAVTDVDGTESQVYVTLPKLLFRAKREQLGGTALLVEYGSELKKFRVNSYAEFKLDDMIEDVYGYLIDLGDYIKTDGFYRIRLSLPSSAANISYQFAYLRDLQFEFIDNPYIFANAGRIEFPANAAIETNFEWDVSDCKKTLPFILDSASHDSSKYMQGRDICLNYHLQDNILPLKFRIPALYFKFQKDSEWLTRPPEDISIRNIPSTLYVCGPFDFKSSKIFIERNPKTSFDVTEITAQKVGGEDYFEFNFSELKSYLDHSEEKRTVIITLNGERHKFLDIICRSKVVGTPSIAPDYENNKLIGHFEIIGDYEYCVKVECNDVLIGEDIPVADGTFELDVDAFGGNYLVTLYEIFEDESGFEPELVELGKYSSKLNDVANLQNCLIEIVKIENRKKKYTLDLSQRHVIGNLQYLGRYQDVCTLSVQGLWGMDFVSGEEMKNCFFYKGILYAGEDLQELFPVMVIFSDRLDYSKCIVLQEDTEYEEYLELHYYYKTHSCIAAEMAERMPKWYKKNKVVLLYDDEYDISVNILDNVAK